MQNFDPRIDELLKKFQCGKCSSAEVRLLKRIYNVSSKSKLHFKTDVDFENIGAEIWSRLPSSTDKGDGFKSSRHALLLRAASIAAIFLVVLGAAYVFFDKGARVNVVSKSVKSKIEPGINSATLTLSNGQKLILSQTTDINLAEQSGAHISKTKDGQLVYIINNLTASNNVGFNTLSTAKGENYQVILPDNTKVWLNAASSITYPTFFAVGKERTIKLVGEAYFEVAKQQNKDGLKDPFIVNTYDQQVKVLGTHFNISSYPDEETTKTVLLEGSVKISLKSDDKINAILKPLQESSVAGNRLIISSIENAEGEVAWKNGLFHFDRSDIKSVMRQVSRWYNVDVIYKGNVNNASFTGEMYKNLSLSNVLEGLSYTGLRFTVSGRNIIVSN